MAHKVIQWRSLGRVLLFLLSCASLLAVTASLPIGQGSPLLALIIGSIAGFGSLALTVLFVRWDGLGLRDVGAMPDGNSLILLTIGFALGLFLVALHSLLVGVAGHTHWVRTARPTGYLASLVVIGYLFLSVREELAFHGYPLRRLQVLVGVWGAQATIAAVFALEHMAGGWPLAQALWGAGVGSLLFGMASIATRGLAVPIGIHAAWNVGDWLRGNRPEPGMWRPEIEKGFEGTAAWTGIWTYVAIMALATFCFWCWHRAREAEYARDA
jgi:membrane protease YdiL (CAAX protease family)